VKTFRGGDMEVFPLLWEMLRIFIGFGIVFNFCMFCAELFELRFLNIFIVQLHHHSTTVLFIVKLHLLCTNRPPEVKEAKGQYKL